MLGSMTTPEPAPPLEPLLTQARLAVWAQERPLLDPEFADIVIDAVSTLVRVAGSPAWTAETLPSRARDIAYIVAKDYYLNPGLLRSETTGPITETRAEAVLRGLELTEAQAAELRALAGAATGVDVDGLWSMGFTRDDPIIHRHTLPRNVLLFDTRGGWPVEYLNEEDAVVFFPEDVA